MCRLVCSWWCWPALLLKLVEAKVQFSWLSNLRVAASWGVLVARDTGFRDAAFAFCLCSYANTITTRDCQRLPAAAAAVAAAAAAHTLRLLTVSPDHWAGLAAFFHVLTRACSSSTDSSPREDSRVAFVDHSFVII